MAIKKISEFTEITALNDNDLFLIERNGEAKYIKAVSSKKYFGSGGGDEPELTPSEFVVEFTEIDPVMGAYKTVTGIVDWINANGTFEEGSGGINYIITGLDITLMDSEGISHKLDIAYASGSEAEGEFITLASETCEFNPTIYVSIPETITPPEGVGKDTVVLLKNSGSVTTSDLPVVVTLKKEESSTGIFNERTLIGSEDYGFYNHRL